MVVTACGVLSITPCIMKFLTSTFNALGVNTNMMVEIIILDPTLCSMCVLQISHNAIEEVKHRPRYMYMYFKPYMKMGFRGMQCTEV